MSYQITIDGFIVHDITLNDKTRMVASPTLTKEVSRADLLTFTMLPTNARYNHANKLSSVVEAFRDGKRVFRGRILNDTRPWGNSKTITCEGDMAFLHDTVVRPYEFEGSVSEYLGQLIERHNEATTSDKRFTLRSVTVTDPNDYITRASSDYPTTYDEIKSKLLDLLGGFLVVEYIDGINYLDYLADSNKESLQVVEVRKNLLDFKQSNNGEDIVTALIPLGAKIENEDGTTETARVDISSANNGLDYIVNEEAAERYGLIFAVKVWDDVTSPSNLLTKGRLALGELAQGSSAVEITALDLSYVDKSVDDFELLDYVAVADDVHDLNGRFLVRKLSIAMDDVANSKLFVGAENKGLTDFVGKTQNTTESVLKDYVQNTVNQQVNVVKQEIVNVSSAIEQSAEEIRTEVRRDYVSESELETTAQTLSTQITQNAEAITLNFNNLTQEIKTVEGNAQSQFEEIEKYIRFEDGDIILGEVGNEITLRLENDRIRFLQTGAEVAYFSNNKLFVTDAEILGSLRIGKFAFLPRANGNTSLKKVVD